MTDNLKLYSQKPKQSIRERSPFSNVKKTNSHKANMLISDVWIVIEYEEYFRQIYALGKS